MRRMRMFLRISVLFSTALFVAGCATTQPYNPFKVPKQEFHTAVHTIALASLEPPSDLEQKDSIKQAFESMIEKRLMAAGFTVVPSKHYEEIRARMLDQIGGLFDAKTGKRDEEKAKALHAQTVKELQEKFHPDAVLYPRFGTFTIKFYGAFVRWHGTQEYMEYGRDELEISWLTRLVPGPAGNYNGTTTALSLGIIVEDAKQVALYEKWGGIQLVTKLKAGLFDRDFTRVPAAEFLQNQVRNMRAVDFALADLVEKTAPAATPAP